jgi:hypothetical protein
VTHAEVRPETHGATVGERGGRWEVGSDFHLVLDAGQARYPWSCRPHVYFGTGRDALRGLLALGRDTLGWRRLLIPSYYCQDVVPSLRRELPVAAYEHAPTSAPAPVGAGAGDVVLVASIFGLTVRPETAPATVVIEDHSHDPLSEWASSSSADFAVASLRKTLPLPDGGVCWSPSGLPLPAERSLTLAHAAATLERLSAMVLKLEYLRGADVNKAEFRRLAVSGEAALDHAGISGISGFSRARIDSLPALEWRATKARNLAVLSAELRDLPRARLLDAPFAATLVFDEPGLRDAVRQALIGASIYPAVLWPLTSPSVAGLPPNHVELSRRILSLHCDFRYGPEDMAWVASAVRRAVEARA